jgi:dTDP-glucose 4,6-dehydratase
MSAILVTGGAGFIGSAVVRRLVASGQRVVTLDKLTYSGSLSSLREVEGKANHRFVEGDIGDQALVAALLREEEVGGIMHLAAESHVDRSIDGPGVFIETNIVGTYPAAPGRARLLARSGRRAETALPLSPHLHRRSVRRPAIRPAASSPRNALRAFLALQRQQGGVRPSGPGLVPYLWPAGGALQLFEQFTGRITFPEKLIPLVILNALEGKPLPVYGKGENVRDWLFVEDHAAALETIFRTGAVGESYNVGGRAERTNLQVVEAICDALDARRPLADGSNRRQLISFVTDRPGHDRRYAIDCSRIERELGWSPSVDFAQGLARTVDWYLENQWWWGPLRARYAGERLGQG